MAVSPLLHQSHEVLNPDFCSGYIDAFGKWNTGFPCPWQDSAAPGFCCGTDNYKYCCSGHLRLFPSTPPGTHTSEDPLLLVLAITLGVAAGITLLILVACFVCPGCLLHKKRRPGPLYRLPCSSTMSTYVPPTTSSGAGGGAGASHHHHSGGEGRGINDVTRSITSTSFGSSQGGMPSFYSLSEPLCPDENEDRTCHHLYWSRTQPPVRMPVNNHAPTHNQGRYIPPESHDPAHPPPPPYEAQHLHSRVVTDSGTRVAPGRHHISPRQPALCIIDDVIANQRDSICSRQEGQNQERPLMMTYHSTKF